MGDRTSDGHDGNSKAPSGDARLTTRQGHPVADNQNQRTVGSRGPATLENYQFLEKISHFEEKGVPVDAYGVGSSLYQGRYDFTGDVVLVEGKPCAKTGRVYRANPRLERVD